ncbi:MAG: DUF3575 domain-containing protein, partial [Paramuribaculum sp.]|nr:DUF3575 domain-containing protein [Paramuribaculum sp.]
MNKPNLIWLLMAVALCVMHAFPLYAQESADSVLTFRFFQGRDGFYAPGLNNGEELARLFDCVDRYKGKIVDHEIMLHVDGYCASKGSEAQNRALAKIRSNRVKSELITRKGLTEDCFITRNHIEKGDYVTVRLFVPKSDIDSAQAISSTEPVAEVVDSVPVETSVNSEPVDTAEQSQPVVAVMPESVSKVKSDSPFALKTNMLGYAVLMPNIEAEWKFTDRWSVALESQGAWWSKSSPRKVYRLATVTPEVRFWAINHSRWHGMYVGAFGGWGLYDLHRSMTKKGHEGEGVMAGLSVGYMWPIGKHLSLDAGVGVGYMRIRDKVYRPAGGHFLYQFTKDINFGPLRLKLSLVWRIP